MLLCAGLLASCGSTHEGGATGAAASHIPGSLLREARPIGAGPRFHPAVGGEPIGTCRRLPGPRRLIHLELFAANRVVLVPAGIGLLPPTRRLDGRITRARCYAQVITLDATGIVLVARGSRATLEDVFRSWGEPLSRHQLLSFPTSPGKTVSAFVDGRRWRGAPGAIPLLGHDEIVLEVGPYVPPHTSFTFPRT